MAASPTSPAPSRRGLWMGEQIAFFDHRCDEPPRRTASTEFYVSAPCIVLISGGAFWTASRQGAAIADAATAVFRNAMAPYTVRDVPGAPSQATTIRIAPAAVRDLLKEIDPSSADRSDLAFDFAATPAPAAAGFLHARLLREFARTDTVRADAMVIEETALHLAAGVLRTAVASHTGAAPRAGPPATSQAQEHVAAAREFLAVHCLSPIKLADVAAAAGCSPWHLARSFHLVTGATIHRHRMALRLRAALDRILSSREDLTSIALACGFCDHSHLTAAFRREFGLTPTAARRSTPPDGRRLGRGL
jgi:AraC family transcriptional regulator